eukprot:9826706-Alexandrium_andersonii.AAC.1
MTSGGRVARRTVRCSRDVPGRLSSRSMSWRSEAPLTSRIRSPALTSRSSPGNWRFHPSRPPPLRTAPT